MASPAHCFYCFEVLSASFERRDPPALQRVLDLYQSYKSATHPDRGAVEKAASAEEIRDSAKVTESEEEDTQDEDEDDDDDDDDDEPSEEEMQRLERRHNNSKGGLQNPSISRLQASSSSSRSSSASASSPSVLSANSSNSQLTTSSNATSTGSSTPATYASRLSVTESFPLFITWNTLSRSGHKSLRGCIGTFEASPLASGLATYALTSALDDTRFSPIPASLLPALHCALTLLADFEPCRDAMDWTLGTHGLRISFNYRNRRHGATYLPDVAVDQGWNKEETLESLMKKAGWDGGYGGGHGVARRLLRGSIRGGGSSSDRDQSQPTKPWQEVQDFKAIRYTGLRSDATYAEWQEWRDWVGKNGVR